MIKKEIIDHWDGEPVVQFTMENNQGMKVEALNFGCRINGLYVPDEKGNIENVVLAYKDVKDYKTDSIYLGAVVGRVAGRIPYGRLELTNDVHHLSLNEGSHHLHGGTTGFSHRFWDYDMEEADDEDRIVFSLQSVDGEEGYPGTVDIKVIYVLEENGKFSIEYEAMSDKTTWVSLTNHTYFNLSGNQKRDIGHHVVQAPAECIFELDDYLIPTGDLVKIDGTPFDIREGRKLKDVFSESHPQLSVANGGFDHFFVFEKEAEKKISVYEEKNGRTLEAATTEPGAVIYTGNKVKDSLTFKEGNGHVFAGICVETERLPEDFRELDRPTCHLEAGKPYKAATTFTFGTKK
ncbi:galactose mutarotase [Salibacterium salarium]|uniref:Aldose 1-epimerase n=1 Tax=Salibacterium salarium TaxID=284579 RepID=A0A3R9PAS1_9BACI|nr:aldose epimerase family protein [Salibacterium salarium]RSL35188.1 galactose mutarotase [Salibacterium salarium]